VVIVAVPPAVLAQADVLMLIVPELQWLPAAQAKPAPQPPQFELLPVVSTQTCEPPARVHVVGAPTGHAHVPLLQAPPIGQFAQVAPQLFGSLLVSVHTPQVVLQPGQVHWALHVPLLQNWPLPQMVPQVPQLLLFELVSTQMPPQFTSSWLQHVPF
jgi:hypothetical protein